MINLYNMDCMEAMAGMPDKCFDLAIVDPPYGNKKIFNGSANFANDPRQYSNHAPSEDYFKELFRISNNQIICGGNYFTLPISRGWIFWYKHVAIPNYSAGEFLWTSFDCVGRCFDYQYTNICDGHGKRIILNHPTAKPVALYRWLLDKYAKPGDKILDTHGGSMSIAIACHDLGFSLDLYEIDKDYFEAGKDRLMRHQQQLGLFDNA